MELPSSNFFDSANGGDWVADMVFFYLKHGWCSGSGNHGLVRGMYFFYLNSFPHGFGNFWMGHVGGVYFFDLLLSKGECTIFLGFWSIFSYLKMMFLGFWSIFFYLKVIFLGFWSIFLFESVFSRILIEFFYLNVIFSGFWSIFLFGSVFSRILIAFLFWKWFV